jgi:REP element-mobilizing transposase RayT
MLDLRGFENLEGLGCYTFEFLKTSKVLERFYMKKLLPLKSGNYYHIYNRGNNRGDIFFEDRNYRYFLERYIKYIVPMADTYAYCLLKNHFHFLLRIKTPEQQQTQTFEVSKTSKVLDPSQQFSNFFNSYAKAINKAYDRTGSLFENRFGRILIDSDRYLAYLVVYIHRNPQKHGFTDDFRTYYYSSYRGIRYQKPSRVKTKQVLEWFGNYDCFDRYHAAADLRGFQNLEGLGNLEGLDESDYEKFESLVGDDY